MTTDYVDLEVPGAPHDPKESSLGRRWPRVWRLLSVVALLVAMAVPVTGAVLVEQAMSAAAATGGCGGG